MPWSQTVKSFLKQNRLPCYEIRHFRPSDRVTHQVRFLTFKTIFQVIFVVVLFQQFCQILQVLAFERRLNLWLRFLGTEQGNAVVIVENEVYWGFLFVVLLLSREFKALTRFYERVFWQPVWGCAKRKIYLLWFFWNSLEGITFLRWIWLNVLCCLRLLPVLLMLLRKPFR